MEALQVEKILGVLYSTSAVTSLVSITSLVIAWQHWTWTLDVCINVDCGCILYGVNTFSTFMGGGVKLCHFAAFGLTPSILVGLCLGVYHGYRSCIPRGLGEPRTVQCNRNYQSSFSKNYKYLEDENNKVPGHCCQRNPSDIFLVFRGGPEGRVVVIGPKPRAPCKHWMTAAFFAVLLCCLSLAHAVVLTDGYYKTCDQYRRNLVRLLGSTGQELQAIHNRLACGAILDFMDYIQPDANNWRRSDQINTGMALQLSIVMSWLNFFAWVAIFLLNINMARKRLKSLDEKMCCCW